MKYKAIGFDYGGVIGGVNAIGTNFKQQVCELLDIDGDTYSNVYFAINHKINLGEIATWREFWTIFLEKTGKPERLEALMAVNDEAAKNLQIIDSKMPVLIDTLRELGFKTGLLSNTTVEGGEDMRAQGLDKHFDVFHISAETKLMKPDPEAFKRLTDDLGVKLDELIFIDDAEKSLSTAKECGFTPILFRDFDDLVRQLRGLTIAI
ncbi:HAD family hydrolase [Candidatus Saccharibacteria bacterium]|nr:MAG: HAD family hydrolase [Candidatus Saccharibacteria bacterium]